MPRTPTTKILNVNGFRPGFATKPSVYQTNRFTTLDNWWPSPSDATAIEVIPGWASIGGSSIGAFSINSIIYGEKSDLTRRYFITGSTSVWTITTAGVTASIQSGLTSGLKIYSVTYADLVHFYNGTDTPFKYDFTTVTNIGLTQPSTSGFTTAATTATTNVVATVKYWHCIVTGTSKGPLSPSFGEIDAENGSEVTITFTSGSKHRFYRTTRDGNTPFFIGAATSTDTTFVDNNHDDDLGGLAPQIGEPPSSSWNFPLVHFNRIWLASASRLFWSDLGEPESFYSVNFLNIQQNDGDQITGLARDREGMFIFKNHHIYKAVGRDPDAEIFQIVELTPSSQNSRQIGCPTQGSIVSTPQGVFFFYQNGFYNINGESQLEYLSEDIEDFLRDNVNPDAQEFVVCAYDPKYRMVLASTPTASSDSPQQTFCYLIDSKAWFRISEGFHALNIVETGTDGQPADRLEIWGNQRLGTQTTIISKLFDTSQTQFQGVPIVSNAILPPIYYDSPINLSTFLFADVMYNVQTGTLVFRFSYDGQADTSVNIDTSTPGGQLRGNQMVKFGQTARQLILTFRTTANQAAQKVYGFQLVGQREGWYDA